jgi:uncharacterized protein
MMFLFFIVALSILFGANFFVYYSLNNFLAPQNLIIKFGLLAILLLYPFIFIAVSMAANYFHSETIRWAYYSMGLFIGLIVNLFFILIAGSILYYLLSIAGISIDGKIFGSILLVFAIVLTFYGAWNARQLAVNEISVPIKNLPTAWKNKVAIQISDTHLGVINREPLMQKITDQIKKINPDIIFITGDFFDGSGDHLAEYLVPFKELAPPDGIFYITGNHETYLGLDLTAKTLAEMKIRWLRDEIIDIDGIQIAGIDYPSRGMSKDIEPILKKLDPQKPSILLYHEPAYTDLARKYGVNLQLAGHTHHGQIFPIGYITNLIYKGFSYGLHTIEDYSIYTTNGAGTWGPPIRTGSRSEIVKIIFK